MGVICDGGGGGDVEVGVHTNSFTMVFCVFVEAVLTFCSFHRIEQNICLVGTSINKGSAVYYYSVTHGLRIIRYL